MAAMEDTIETQPLTRRAPFVSIRRIIIASLVIIVLVVGGLLAYNKLRRSAVDRGSIALIEAFRDRRVIEPRLSSGFHAGEFRPWVADRSNIYFEKLAKAGVLIRDSVAKGDLSAQLPYARLLLLSEGQRLAEGLKYLRREVAAAPESVEAHNDLGVGLIQEGKLEDALDEFEAALKRRPNMPEALFNRALCHQKLLLTQDARAGFTRLLELEQDRQWREEIKRRIEELSERTATATNPRVEFDAAYAAGQIEEASRLVEQNSEALRTHALWRLATRYLRNVVDGEPARAERALSKIELIGSVLSRMMSDSGTADTARYLRSLQGSRRRIELALISEYVATSRIEPTYETCAIFERLENQFRLSSNYVFEALAAFKVADYYYKANRFSDSITKIKRILHSMETRAWSFDRARFLNELALDTSRMGQDSLSIKYFEQAISLCGESPENASKILQYMSVPYAQLGDLDGALVRLRESTKLLLENALRPGTLANLAYNYSQIASIYGLRNQHPLALLCAEQALKYSDQAKLPAYAAEFSSFVAVEYARLGQFEKSEAALERALAYLEVIEKGIPRNLTEARVLTKGIDVAVLAGEVQRALAYYDRADGLVAAEEGNTLLRVDLLRGRANAYVASGQHDMAQSDLMAAVTLIEDYRSRIATSEQRSHFLDASHSVFDQLISLDAGPLASTAFEMSELSRARALLEDISRTVKPGEELTVAESSEEVSRDSNLPPLKPLTLEEVQGKLPEDLAILEYSVTSKATYVFLVTRSNLKVEQSPATTASLDRLVREYIDLLQNIGPLDDVNAKARELYDYLIKPIEKEIEGHVNLCIVPDKALHRLPFAGFVNGSKQYFFESHRLTYAPSASVLIRCLDEEGLKPAGVQERILGVGDPEFNSANFPKLESLTDAEIEVRELSKFYPPALRVTLTKALATEPSVVAAMKECDIAHLALHCLVAESSPWLAALVLTGTKTNEPAPLPDQRSAGASSPAVGAAGTGAIKRSAALTKALPQSPAIDPNDGMLYLSELYGMKLPRMRMVVLSACQSGLGQYYRGEGIVSLVRPLLAAGVPTVVASLWPVDSQATSELMIEFHKQRKLAGLPAGEALRRAQRELSRSHEHPYFWAPFIVVGSSSAPK